MNTYQTALMERYVKQHGDSEDEGQAGERE
jgi:hypothetical protein